jgi:phage I-like protein
MTNQLFSTLKTKETNFHSSVGFHTSIRWTEYAIQTIEGKEYLLITYRINGIVDNMVQLGTVDTQAKLRSLGVN